MQSLDLNSKIPSVSRRKPAYIDVYVDKIDLYKFFNFNFGNFIFKLCRRTEISFIFYRSKCFVVKMGAGLFEFYTTAPLLHFFGYWAKKQSTTENVFFCSTGNITHKG